MLLVERLVYLTGLSYDYDGSNGKIWLDILDLQLPVSDCCIQGYDQHDGFLPRSFFFLEKFNSKQQLQDMVIPLQSRWRNSHVLVFHSPLLSHILGVAPSTFTTV